MKLNFEDGAEEESINVNLDDDIEAEQGKLVEGVQQLLDKTEHISQSGVKEEISPELISEMETEASDIREGVLSMSERGFITPGFAARLVPLAASFGILTHPQILDTLQRDTASNIVLASLVTGVVATLSICRNVVKRNKAKWSSPDKGYDFVETDLEELKSRWGFGKK